MSYLLEVFKMTSVYRVLASSITYYAVNVEADTEQEAWDIAGNLDGGDFMELDEVDWQIDSVIMADSSHIANYRLIELEE